MKTQDKLAEVRLHEKLVDQSVRKKFNATKNDRQRYLELLELTDLRDKLILDAGCGQGMDGVILSLLGNTVVGVELSHGVAQKAKELAHEVDFEVLVADMERLPIRAGAFDVVYCGWVLHHFKYIQQVISELARVLTPKGNIAIVEPNGSSIAVKLTQLIEGVARPCLVNMCADTPNETLHTAATYTKVLDYNGFTRLNVHSCHFGDSPPLPHRSRWIFSILVRIRNLIYGLLMSVTGSLLKGTDLLIMAQKRGK